MPWRQNQYSNLYERKRKMTRRKSKSYRPIHLTCRKSGLVVVSLIFLAFLVVGARSGLAQDASEHLATTLKAMGEPGSVRVTPALGVVSDIIPIEVPPGRRNVQPRLALTYNSMAGPSDVGRGWQLDTGRVSRWRGDGTPTVGDPCSFSYDLAGAGGQLIPSNDNPDIYRAKLETVYREFRRLGDQENDGWTMSNGEGVVHRFGSTPESRIEDIGGRGQLWMLDLVMDRSGNTITYSYERVHESLYPKEIRYTGFIHNEDPGANRITFEYEDRPDVRISYNNSVRSMHTRRLKRISIFAGEDPGDFVRKYDFSYVQGRGGQSLLKSVVLVGTDGSGITLRTFEYTERELPWIKEAATGTIPLPLVDEEGRDYGTRVVDLNGDGFVDVVGNWGEVHLGDGCGNFTKNNNWSNWLFNALGGIAFVVVGGDNAGADAGVRLVDINGDGLSDLVTANALFVNVQLNTGNGWQSDPNYVVGWYNAQAEAHVKITDITSETVVYEGPNKFLPQPVPLWLVGGDYESSGVRLVDVNGDGRLDIMWSWRYTVDTFCYQVHGIFLNTGKEWVKDDTLTDALASIGESKGEFAVDGVPVGWDMLDINGDGIADLMQTLYLWDVPNPSLREVLLGTGSGWVLDSGYTDSLNDTLMWSLTLWTDKTRFGMGLVPVDFDEDGLTDFLYANSGFHQMAYRNTGTGWVVDPNITGFLTHPNSPVIFNVWADDCSWQGSLGYTLGDVDGDGISDLLGCACVVHDEFSYAHNRVFLSCNGVGPGAADKTRSGLIRKVTSALGEVTEITWDVSTSVENHTSSGAESLPIALPIATSLTRSDGRGMVYETTYDYRGGLLTDRQFRGFGWSCQKLPSGLEVVTNYYQDEGLAGNPSEEKEFETVGDEVRLKRARYSQYDTRKDGEVTQIRLRNSDVGTIDPGGERWSRVERDYDDRLNCVSVYRDPDVAFEGDETTMTFECVENEDAGIWSLPWRIRTLGPDGSRMTESIMVYDSLPLGQADRGLPSEIRHLTESGPDIYVSKFMEYDDLYGNLVRLTDQEGNVTEFDYDGLTATFRTRAVDPEGREVRSEYDPRFGMLIRDVDASGNVTLKDYDAFGRLYRVTLPGDEASPFRTQTYEYSPLWHELGPGEEMYYLVKETETPGEPDTLVTTHFFDGLERIYRVERDGPDGRTVVTQTEFDDAGNPVRTSLPYFKDDTPLWSEIQRDVLHRPVRILDPDGEQLTIDYAGPRVDVVDRRGSQNTFFRNGDGQVTEIRQQVDGQEQVTRYGYDALGRLTSIVDALDCETRIAYDLLGRRVRLEDLNAGTYSYSYDAEGRLVEQTAPDGQTTSFYYNGAGDLIRKEFPDGTSHIFTYGTSQNSNAAGRIVQIKDSAGIVDLRYDSRGNVVERRREVLGRTYVTGYSYDSLGRVRRVTYPDGFTANYEYDSGGNVTRISDGRGRVVAEGMDYNAAGQLEQLTFGNGVRSSFTYDPSAG